MAMCCVCLPYSQREVIELLELKRNVQAKQVGVVGGQAVRIDCTSAALGWSCSLQATKVGGRGGSASWLSGRGAAAAVCRPRW